MKKEQIEKDLAAFQPIASATVALSLPPEDHPQSPPSLSVILSLHDHEQLSPSLRRSIFDYLLSSVPGLTTEHITLSDTLGNIYALVDDSSLSYLLATCENYLGKIFPKEHFALSSIPSQTTTSIQLTVNEKYLQRFSKIEREKFLSYVQDHLQRICGDTHPILIEKFPFSQCVSKKCSLYTLCVGIIILLVSLGIIALATFFLAFYAYDGIHPHSEIKQGINMTKLIEILQKESPEKIGMILSYLDPHQAEELLNHLPEDMKNQVLRLNH